MERLERICGRKERQNTGKRTRVSGETEIGSLEKGGWRDRAHVVGVRCVIAQT